MAVASNPAALVSNIAQAKVSVAATATDAEKAEISAMATPTAADIVVQQPVVTVQTASPTPAPTTAGSSSGGGGGGIMLYIIIGGVVVVVVGLAGVGYFMWSRGQEKTVFAKQVDTDDCDSSVKIEMDGGRKVTSVGGHAAPEGAVYMKNGVWHDAKGNPV